MGIPGGGSEEIPWPRPSPLLGVLSGRACQAELSARVRRDEFLREAPLCPGLPAADPKGWQASLQALSLPELSGALEERVQEMGESRVCSPLAMRSTLPTPQLVKP